MHRVFEINFIEHMNDNQHYLSKTCVEFKHTLIKINKIILYAFLMMEKQHTHIFFS